MIYLVTHTFREGGPNPSLTDKGMALLSRKTMASMVHFIRFEKKTKIVYRGIGRRFRETCDAYREELRGLEIKSSHLFGTGESRTDIEGEGDVVITADGHVIPGREYVSLADFPGLSWQVLYYLPPGTIIFTGRDFCRGIGLESQSGSIYEADECRQKIITLVNGGTHLRQPSVL